VTKEQKQVFVALSGGVDSSVAALLLKNQGHRVSGVFIKIWQPEFVECTWREDRIDAMRVAAALEIPFYEIDLSAEYKKHVIDSMLSDYRSGVTPNPDVLCNRFIKFGALWDFVKGHGADFLATGHHARVQKVEEQYKLLKGVDGSKDQSYFLWQLTQEDLSHTLMPIGEMQKSKVRSIAEQHDLPVANKPDSQGLCFVGHVDMHDFLRTLLKTKQGKVLDVSGAEIGIHDGAALYTHGQRHGFSVTTKQPHSSPYYVSEIDVEKNVITVTNELKKEVVTKTVTIHNCNWVSPISEEHLSCALRYHHEPQKCKIRDARDSVTVEFVEEQQPTPGQSLVVYKEDVCIGGGIIGRR